MAVQQQDRQQSGRRIRITTLDRRSYYFEHKKEKALEGEPSVADSKMS
jgi:hypothetical protein